MNAINVIFRNFAKHKLFFLVSIIGLSLAMSIATLLIAHINFEKNFDTFYPDTDNIYRINFHTRINGEETVNTCRTHSALGYVLSSESELLAAAGRAYYEECYMYTDDVKLHTQHVVWADSSFINVFQHEMILGDPNTALASHYSVVISDVVAKKYFGTRNPIGKVIKLNEGIPFNVTGVFKAMPANTHMYYDFMVSYCTLEHWGNNMRQGNWKRPFPATYIRKKATVSELQVEQLLQNMADKYLTPNKTDGEEFSFSITPVKDIYLKSNQESEFKPQGNELKVNLLLVVAIFIVVIAWANNINVFTALSFERLKNAGIRKINGARNRNLFTYNLKESFIVNLAAVLISLVAVVLVYPYFNQYIAYQTYAKLFSKAWFWAMMVGFLIVGTFIITAISTIIQSSFKPINVLNKTVGQNFSFSKVRHALVVFQFMLAIILISCTILIYKQINYLEQSDLGMKPEQVLVLRAPASNNTTGPKRYHDFCAFRQELLRHSAIKNVTASLNIPGQVHRNNDIKVNFRGNPQEVLFNISHIDNNFFETFQVPLVAGRNFYNDIENEKNNIILNQKAVEALALRSPHEAIGQTLKFRNNEFTIVGVVRNFHHESLQKNLEPFIYQFVHPKEFGYYPVRVHTTNMAALSKTIEKVWYRHYPEAQADYFFLDSYFNKQYSSFRQLANLAGISAFFALLISCLGLFALASYAVNKRTKEIGIRKVNGASIAQIILMLNKGFLKWVVIAIALAIPLAWYAMHRWLQNFAYKTDIHWSIFAVAGMLVLLIALITVSVQSWRAATANPATTLHNE